MKTKKIQYIVVEKFTKKNSLQNLTRFHSGLFEFEILEILQQLFKKKLLFVFDFFFVFLQLLQSALLKNEKKIFNPTWKDRFNPPNNYLTYQEKKKTLKKRKEKQKMRKSQAITMIFFFLLSLFYIEKLIFC